MCNDTNTTLYIGVTNNIERRVKEHKCMIDKDSFSCKYNCSKLVYYEEYRDIRYAISREKQLKNWERKWKNQLVERHNPEWLDLAKNW